MTEARIRVSVVLALAPRQVVECALLLPPGATVAYALRSSGVLERVDSQELDRLQPGIWGKRVELAHALQDGDRLELWRPLKVDPKTARRERFARQGAKTAGLFQQRRKGAKAGY